MSGRLQQSLNHFSRSSSVCSRNCRKTTSTVRCSETTVYHKRFSSYADLDLNENNGGFTDLAKRIARISGFTPIHPRP